MLRNEELARCWLAGTNRKRFFNREASIAAICLNECCDKVEKEADTITSDSSRKHLQSPSAKWQTIGHILRGIATIHAAQVDILYDSARILCEESKFVAVMFENGLDKKKEDTIDTMPILHFDYNIGAMSTVDFERLFENNNNVSDESRITLPEPVTDRPIADNEILDFDEQFGEYFDGDEQEDVDNIIRHRVPRDSSPGALCSPHATSTPRCQGDLHPTFSYNAYVRNLENFDSDGANSVGEMSNLNIELENNMLTPIIPMEEPLDSFSLSALPPVKSSETRRKPRCSRKNCRLKIDAEIKIPDSELKNIILNRFSSCEPPKMYVPSTNIQYYACAFSKFKSMTPFDLDVRVDVVVTEFKKPPLPRKLFVNPAHGGIAEGSRFWNLIGQHMMTQPESEVDNSILDAILGTENRSETRNCNGSSDVQQPDNYLSEFNAIESTGIEMDRTQRKRSANESFDTEKNSLDDSFNNNDFDSMPVECDSATESYWSLSSSAVIMGSSEMPQPISQAGLIPAGTPFHALLVEAHHEWNLPINAASDLDQNALEQLCYRIRLEPLRGRFCELVTLQKLMWFWRRNIHPVNMLALNYCVPSRLNAAKSFASLLVLRLKRLIDIACNEKNEIIHISKGEDLQYINIF